MIGGREETPQVSERVVSHAPHRDQRDVGFPLRDDQLVVVRFRRQRGQLVGADAVPRERVDDLSRHPELDVEALEVRRLAALDDLAVGFLFAAARPDQVAPRVVEHALPYQIGFESEAAQPLQVDPEVLDDAHAALADRRVRLRRGVQEKRAPLLCPLFPRRGGIHVLTRGQHIFHPPAFSHRRDVPRVPPRSTGAAGRRRKRRRRQATDAPMKPTAVATHVTMSTHQSEVATTTSIPNAAAGIVPSGTACCCCSALLSREE